VPTVLRERGFEVRIYTLDHAPPHVHVAKPGAILKIDLATHQATEIVGSISDHDVKLAERIVAQHATQLKEHWEKIHGGRHSKRTRS
jgi:pterin-4a-carbinolamine dehydratase